MPSDTSRQHAAQSLEAIAVSQRMVSATSVPRWYFRSLAVALLALRAVQDTHNTVAIVAVAVVFAVAAMVVITVVARATPYRLPRGYWPGRGWSLAAWIAGLVVAGVGTALAVRATGFPLPNTVSGLVVAAGILLMDRWQRRLARHDR